MHSQTLAASSRRQRCCNRCQGEGDAGEAADPLVPFVRRSPRAGAGAACPGVELAEGGGEVAGPAVPAQFNLTWSS